MRAAPASEAKLSARRLRNLESRGDDPVDEELPSGVEPVEVPEDVASRNDGSAIEDVRGDRLAGGDVDDGQDDDGTEDCKDPNQIDTPCEFHVVGLGASAGGLEALETFVSRVPPDSGMAFVVIQHLSPDFDSHMQQLLSRKTELPVHRAENEMVVERNSIYLIPPRMEMIISEGRLLLKEKLQDGTISQPIDHFFRSLAVDIGRYSIAVVLSGTGSDGSRGLVDVRKAGGLTISQEPSSAAFDGMPRSAIDTGAVNLILPPTSIPQALIRYVRDGLSPEAIVDEGLALTPLNGVDRVFELLEAQHGLDFTHYKSGTVSRRIQRRVVLAGVDSLDEYIEQLEDNPSEINDLYKDLLIGVTKFFRDTEAFEELSHSVIPQLVREGDPAEPIRVWVAGCASGEEAYSIAMLIDEAVRAQRINRTVKVFATDAHHVSLQRAAAGVYDVEAMKEMSAERRGRYFEKKRDGWHIRQSLRRCVIFAAHNVLKDVPFTQMGLVTCRNMLIYLHPSAQRKALSLFHFALRPGGHLFLGPSETTGDLRDEFEEVDKRWRIYRKVRDIRLPIEPVISMGSRHNDAAADFEGGAHAHVGDQATDRSLMATYDQLLDLKMPPSILVNDRFEILHIFGGAQRFLSYQPGRPINDVLATIHPKLRTPLTGALQHAMRRRETVRYFGIQVPTSEQELLEVQIVVELVSVRSDATPKLLIELQVLDELAPEDGPSETIDVDEISQERIRSLENDLRASQENLQATIEEMETANEELQATNEELTASNEELQSTNEELHSVNEELYTINAEHQRRVEELTEANLDMDNLLATTRVGVIFLDQDLAIRRFTPEMARLFHLVPQDIGRNIRGFAHNLVYDDFENDLLTAYHKQIEIEVAVRDRMGKHFLLRMMPYRTADVVEGVVMTLVDVEKLTSAQATAERFRYMAEASSEMFLLLNADGEIDYANPATENTTGMLREELLGKDFSTLVPSLGRSTFHHYWYHRADIPRDPIVTKMHTGSGDTTPVEVSLSPVEFHNQRYMFALVQEIAHRQRAEHELRLQLFAIESAVNGILISDLTQPDNPIVYANRGFCKMTGYEKEDVLGRNCRFLQGDDTDPATVQQIREAVAARESCYVVIRNYRKDGTPFWNELQLTPAPNEHGEVVNYVGVQHDVSYRYGDGETPRSHLS